MANYITAQGLVDLNKEYDSIINIKIPEVLTGLTEALSAGDLKENSARDVLLVEQQRLNSEKVRIESILNSYEIIEETTQISKTIRIGSTVKIAYPEEKKEFTVHITGNSEANALETPARIANDSPLAQGILGKKAGDEVTVRIKNNRFVVKVIEILE